MHFQIVTEDNPDMVETLKRHKQMIKQSLDAFPPDTLADTLADHEKILTKQFQKQLSTKAYQEQLQLIEIIKHHGVPVRMMVEDKGHVVVEHEGSLQKAHFEYFTDQIFASDTGQYYDKDGVLHFIPASFKNAQRQGEERLAIAQAENFGAIIQPLKAKTGKTITFEGGDIRQMIGKKLFFIGQGHRSDPLTAQAIADASGYFVLPIQLLQAQFYHLDCCFLPLPNDAALLYEGDYVLNEHGNITLDEQGWPVIIPGTETMTATSRELIRMIYPSEKLVLISKDEALAFATNAVVLQNPITNKFKLFVNGKRDETIDELTALKMQTISLTKAHIQHIDAVSNGVMDLIEVPYSTMHGSGGSIRCTVLELACSSAALTPLLALLDSVAKTFKNRHGSKSATLSYGTGMKE